MIADYYNKFPYVQKMSSISSKEVISPLVLFFSTCTPEEIICDNGTQFTNNRHKKFTDKRGFTMTTSSLTNQEIMASLKDKSRFIKKLFNRCDEDGTNHHVALQELRATPLESNTWSPAELLHGRQMKTTLQAIIKSPQNREVVRESLQSRKDFSSYDAQAKRDPLSYLPNQFG